jgi:periplasmic copper chaperone A
MRFVLAASMLFAIPAITTAASAQTGPVVEHAWARATTASAQTGAAYLVVHAASPDQLTGFSTPIAATAELHQSHVNNGVMEMRPVASLPVGPGHDVTLAPGGYHVMLMGLKQPLKPGDHFPLTLTFAHAGAVTTEVTVGRAGASGPGSAKQGGADMGGMDMGGMDMTGHTHP